MHFLVDLMCGGVVSYLRMCGHDAVYAGDEGLEADDALIRRARREHRTVVTRDAALAGREAGAILLESTDVEAQLRELEAAGVALTLADEPTRCGRCNGPLEPVDGTESTPPYAPDPVVEDVRRCRDCGQHFWKGSHWDRVRETLSEISPSSGDDAWTEDGPGA